MKSLLLSFLLFVPMVVFSQNDTTFSGISISGYLQTQFQKAQSPGINSWSGGDFDENADNRFMIRRGRVKVQRVDQFSSVVFQLDGTQDGVRLMDAFLNLHHPKHQSLSLTAGLFNRPFGYSIGYSSGDRDFPERARVFQTVMPRERDVGAMISFQPQKYMSFLNAQFAVVNGSGISGKDYDSKKDIIGNLGFEFDSLTHQKLNIGFGASFYSGSVRSNTDTYYKPVGASFAAVPNATGKNLSRQYYGVNLQLGYDNSFGYTTFKSEYIQGTQPGVASSANISGFSASQSFSKQPLENLYLRNFNGYYFWFTQQIANSNLTAIVGYDIYDPNTNIAEKEIGLPNTNTTAGDIKFSTLGYGLTYEFNDRVKFTLYNEHVKNGNTMLTDYQADLKDNVFTIRAQYKW